MSSAFKFCPRCANPLAVGDFGGAQRLGCSCGFVHWDNPLPVVAAIVEHEGGPAPTRTWSNLLESAHEEDLFEHYFAVGLARVEPSGRVQRLGATPGLLASVAPSPDGSLAVLTRIQKPFSRLVPALQFPSVVELWDLATEEPPDSPNQNGMF